MSYGFFPVGDVLLREGPAREACFRVVQRDTEMEEQVGTGERARRELVHRHMSNEITSLDIAAQCVADYPDAPWEIRMQLARQCWDESRHVEALHQRLRELGGHKGEFPIAVFEWSVTCAVEDLAGRLATQNRTFEAGAMDVVEGLVRTLRAAGDPGTADVLDAILADEVQHVRFANRWLRERGRQDPRVLMRVAMAVRFLARANALLAAQPGETSAAGAALAGAQEGAPAVNVRDRLLAEFSEDEVHEILRQAGFRSLLPERAGP